MLPRVAAASIRRGCAASTTASAAAAASRITSDGAVLLPAALPAATLQTVDRVLRGRARHVMAALGDRPIGVGSKVGYEEVVQRSLNRFDIPVTEADLRPIWGAAGSLALEVPWLPLVRQVLGAGAVPSFCGVVFSRPDSPPQQWHIDSPHRGQGEHRAAHAMNVLVALGNVTLEAGPTEVALGSHRLTNHVARPWLDRDDMLYQTTREVTPQVLLRGQEEQAECPSLLQALQAGDALCFDDRCLHRGLANTSQGERWVAYFSYSAGGGGVEEAEETHFEATRSLFA
jgi:hypothetical protein